MPDFSDYGERTTDDFPSKKRTAKLEAEIKKLKTTTSAVLQTITTTFSDSMDMNMQGHMVYEIAPLTTTIKPKKAGSRLQITMNVMCCPQMVHLFTLAIYVNDKTVVTGTKADKQNTHYADAVVPITKWESDTSLLYSCSKQISVKKPKNKKEVVVQVYAFYHKDIDATAKTAHLMINEAMKTPKGLAYTVVGSSTLTVEEVV
jgi:hypothetical protein